MGVRGRRGEGGGGDGFGGFENEGACFFLGGGGERENE